MKKIIWQHSDKIPVVLACENCRTEFKTDEYEYVCDKFTGNRIIEKCPTCNKDVIEYDEDETLKDIKPL